MPKLLETVILILFTKQERKGLAQELLEFVIFTGIFPRNIQWNITFHEKCTTFQCLLSWFVIKTDAQILEIASGWNLDFQCF